MATTPQTMHHTTTGIDNRKLLMWIFLANECLFFGSLIATYLIFKGEPMPGPLADDVLNIPVTSASTFVLLMSSLAMVLAVYGAHHARPGMMKVWLLATILLGLTFLGFQVYEFRHFAHEYHLGLSTNQFGAAFYVMTGFHGTHVGVGVIYLASLLFASMRRNGLGRETGFHVETAGLYWHFVDIVWIVIFTVVYLIPA
ncbi:MAG: cytochrome oxidase subunit III [Dehalococcoidia bacterium]|nr:cytochrome oxidase subunit III [Dehalococcoidia bacterium]